MATPNEKSSNWINGATRQFAVACGAIAASLSLGFCGTSGYLNVTERDPSGVLEDSFKRDLRGLGRIPLLSPEGEPMRLVIDLPEARPKKGDNTTAHQRYYAMPVIDFGSIAEDPQTGVEAKVTMSSESTTTTTIDPDTTDLGSLDLYTFHASLQPDDLGARGLTGEEIALCDDRPDRLCSEAVDFNGSAHLQDLAKKAVARCLGDARHTTDATAEIATAIQGRQAEIFTSRVVVWDSVVLPESIADDPSFSDITCRTEVI